MPKRPMSPPRGSTDPPAASRGGGGGLLRRPGLQKDGTEHWWENMPNKCVRLRVSHGNDPAHEPKFSAFYGLIVDHSGRPRSRTTSSIAQTSVGETLGGTSALGKLGRRNKKNESLSFHVLLNPKLGVKLNGVVAQPFSARLLKHILRSRIAFYNCGPCFGWRSDCVAVTSNKTRCKLQKRNRRLKAPPT